MLAEIDYLKPHFDAHPEDRADLRAFIAAGRIEIVGGSYNEPNTNLTCAESTIRNAIYGLGYQRDVLGADPQSAWMLDAFGHDPGYPGLMAAAGLTASAWARGPVPPVGPERAPSATTQRMQFASEFEWISPDGHGLLTSYMANHYGAGWVTHQAADLDGGRAGRLRAVPPAGAGRGDPERPAAGRRRPRHPVPVGHRHPPGLERALRLAAVRHRAAARVLRRGPRRGRRSAMSGSRPQTRDMNPVYPGKDVSYIDTKQAQRAAEIAVTDGERLAAAGLAGRRRRYPAAESLDKAWRQLAFGAHHDAITGTESDQVYLDLLGGWREAWRARRRRPPGGRRPPGRPGRHRGRRGPAAGPAGGRRRGGVQHAVPAPRRPWPASRWLAAPGPGLPSLADESGQPVPCLAERPAAAPGRQPGRR